MHKAQSYRNVAEKMSFPQVELSSQHIPIHFGYKNLLANKVERRSNVRTFRMPRRELLELNSLFTTDKSQTLVELFRCRVSMKIIENGNRSKSVLMVCKEVRWKVLKWNRNRKSFELCFGFVDNRKLYLSKA